MSETRYFAYGANLSSAALRARGIVANRWEIAQLEDFSLAFAVPGIPVVEPAFATIRHGPGSHVHGALFLIDDAQLELLDRLEDCPRSYRRVSVAVEGVVSGRASAYTYQAVAPQSGLAPSRRYLNLIVRGAVECGLPAAWIEWLQSHRVASVSAPQWLWRRLVSSPAMIEAVVTLSQPFWSARRIARSLKPAQERRAGIREHGFYGGRMETRVAREGE